MRFLLVTKEFSESPTSGGTQRTLALARALVKLCDDLIVVSPTGTWRYGGGLASRMADLPPAKLSRYLLCTTYKSLSGARTGGPQLLANLQRACAQDYDVAVVDHTCIAGLSDIVANHARFIVVSMHNVESQLMAERAPLAPSLALEWAMRVESRLLRRLEQSDTVRACPVIVVSPQDRDALATGSYGWNKPIVCENGIFAESITVPDEPLDPQRLLFTGALDWEPNVQGLEWFLLTSWPRIRAAYPAATFTIAGRNPSVQMKRAARLQEGNGVRMVADPPQDHMEQLLGSHGLGVVPLLKGGGSRIKILEYLAHGMDVVSTETGANGLSIPTELMSTGPDAVIWETTMQAMGNPRDNRKAATDWVREHHTWDRTLLPLQKLITDRLPDTTKRP